MMETPKDERDRKKISRPPAVLYIVMQHKLAYYIPRSLLTMNALTIFVYGTIFLPHASSQNSSKTDFSCNLESDSCPYQMDGRCNNDLPECEGGDCADCDACYLFDLDCESCLEYGCHWCGASGKCANSDGYIFDESDCIDRADFSQETCSPPDNFFSDPLFPTQKWVYDLINVMPVWEKGYTGKGIKIRINDDGVSERNPEFDGRFDVNGSCAEYDHSSSRMFHGTAMASIAAGGSGNNCAVGIAPEATISSCHIFNDIASVLAAKLEHFDISHNSYGINACNAPGQRRRRLQATCPFQFEPSQRDSPCSICDFSSLLQGSSQPSCEAAIVDHCLSHYDEDIQACIEFLDVYIDDGRCRYNILPEDQRAALVKGVTEGRNGKGAIYVWASGNTRRAGDDTNFQGFLNTRFTIVVGAVDRQGFHAPYSVGGAALFVTAPGGSDAYAVNFVVAKPGSGSGCNSPRGGYGTSFAAPVVSGVVALMLEANSDLSWRDVQGILASTSKHVQDDSDDRLKTLNSAGLYHSDLYGFGVVQADAAVEAAKEWEYFPPERFLMGDSNTLNASIVDNAESTLASIISFEFEVDDFIAESVVVYLETNHFSRGDLEVLLTSPGGTTSVLHPGNRPENTQLTEDDQWKFLTVKSWGEIATGEWVLSIRDVSKGDVAECVDYPFSVSLNGTERLTCKSAEQREYCFGSQARDTTAQDILDATDEGRNATTACCVCGGGILPADIVDRLTRWRLIVYGHTRRSKPTATTAPTKEEPPTQNVNASSSTSFSAGVWAWTAIMSLMTFWCTADLNHQ